MFKNDPVHHMMALFQSPLIVPVTQARCDCGWSQYNTINYKPSPATCPAYHNYLPQHSNAIYTHTLVSASKTAVVKIMKWF